MNDWPVKLPGHLRPAIQQIAKEEFLPVPEVIRAMVQKAVFQRQLERSKRDKLHP
jgi:hypothetical protein